MSKNEDTVKDINDDIDMINLESDGILNELDFDLPMAPGVKKARRKKLMKNIAVAAAVAIGGAGIIAGAIFLCNRRKEDDLETNDDNIDVPINDSVITIDSENDNDNVVNLF